MSIKEDLGSVATRLGSALSISGPKLNCHDCAVLSQEDLKNINPNAPSQNYKTAENNISQAAKATFAIDKYVKAYLLDKNRAYTPLLDFMLLLLNRNPIENFIHSIKDLNKKQLAKILGLAENILCIYAKKTKQPILAAVAFNYHDQPLQLNKLNGTGVKTSAQTIDAAHAHILGITLNELLKARETSSLQAEKSANENEKILISKREHRDIYEPLMPLIRLLLEIPSIDQEIIYGLEKIVPEKNGKNFQVLPTGVQFAINTSTLADEELARELQLLQGRFENIYQQIANLIVNPQKPDAYGMPNLRIDTTNRVENFCKILMSNPLNNNAKKEIEHLERLLKKFRSLLQPMNARRASKGEQTLFMRNFACTLILYRELSNIEKKPVKGEAPWHLILAPRIVSTGNGLSALNLHKTTEGKTNKSWHRIRRAIGKAF